MQTRLLDLFQEELAHLREGADEFARDFPRAAGRLALDRPEIPDPHVERLLQGVAYLNARVRLKLDAEYPQLAAQLLAAVDPDALSPVPSMLVACCRPDPQAPRLAEGLNVPRGTRLVGEAQAEGLRCEFRTGHDLTLWPLEVVDISCRDDLRDLPSPPAGAGQAVGGLRLRLRRTDGGRMSQLPLDRLRLHLAASDAVSWPLHDALSAALGTWVTAPGAPPANHTAWRGPSSLRSPGCDDTEALLPVHPHAPPGGRLWRELAALPARHLFIELTDLHVRWPTTLGSESGDTVDVVILLPKIAPGLADRVGRSALVPFCVTAVNAFERRLERVQLDPRQPEAALIVDRLRPRDHVVLSVLSVQRTPDGPGDLRRLRPLHGPAGNDADSGAGAWTSRRVRVPPLGVAGSHSECRLAVTAGKSDCATAAGGPATNDPLEVRSQAPSLLVVVARVGEGDRPLQVAATGARWWLDAVGVGDVCITCGPSRPHTPDPEGPSAWSLVDALRWNHLSLVDEVDPARAADALRQLIVGHGPLDDPVWLRLAASVRSVRAVPVVRRLPGPGPMVHARGVAVRVDMEMDALQGPGFVAFGAVLDRSLAAQAAANSFVELSLADANGRVKHRFSPRVGDLPLV